MESKPLNPQTFKNSNIGTTHNVSTSALANVFHIMPQVVLATINVPVYDIDGVLVIARALLDSGSTATFITERFFKKLKLVRGLCEIQVNTVGASASQCVNGCVPLRIKKNLLMSDEPICVDALIMSRVVGILPPSPIVLPDGIFNDSRRPEDFADENWNVPKHVDLLLGADVYHSIVTGDSVAIGTLSLISTIYGLAVSGPIPNSCTSHINCNHLQISPNPMDMELFWKIEEVPELRSADYDPGSTHQARVICRSAEEDFAERHFNDTCAWTADGRIVTTLPFIGDVNRLGNSERASKNRFLNLEKKLEKSPKTYAQYREFMQEFIDLNHMELVPDAELNLHPSQCYYIPHHCVFKDDSTTTKLRVVFDASASTSSGTSLNDLLAAGPKLQDDLFHILVRFRFKFVAITGDIAKMYRQILLDEKGKDYHRLFWRANSSSPLQVFRMTRVTYGVKSASHSAIKALQLTFDRFGTPETQMVRDDFYVDDLLSGDQSVAKANTVIKSVRSTLKCGGFDLRKMGSNEPSIINSLPADARENVDAFEFADEAHTIKTLGLLWIPISDTFAFKVTHLDSHPESSKDVKRALKAMHRPEQNPKIPEICPTSLLTRRQVLSDIAKIFDPLGLLSPCVVKLKICMQDIWRTQLGWDDNLPITLIEPYLEWRDSLVLLRECKIPRKIQLHFNNTVTELHIFCDASTKAYGAVIYVRSSMHDETSVNMLTSKCKVAPLKHITVPKLELCAALTGVRLLQAVLYALRHSPAQYDIFAWTDSTTVLQWLSNLPGRWQTFVANRVSQIQDVLPRSKWLHIPTDKNPADLLSRGMPVKELLTSDFWWHGPKFLQQSVLSFPVQPTDEEISLCTDEEKKIVPAVLAHAQTVPFSITRCFTTRVNELQKFESVPGPSLLNIFSVAYYSNLNNLLNLVSMVQRFADVLMKRRSKFERRAFITSKERRASLAKLTISVQEFEFSEELTTLRKGVQVNKSNRLSKLYPFIDADDGVLRVGGRLHARSESLSQNTLYPAILTKHSPSSSLLAYNVHEQTLHGGLHMCIAELRRTYWIISSRQLFRELLRNCVICFRFNSKPLHALMGDLPKERITPSKPFTHTGLDYAGPLASKIKGGTEKVYLAIFVCFSTKAVHIEVVSKLTSQACIAAIHRFAARRGVPSRLYSDNATNFNGARGELESLRRILDASFGLVPKEVERMGMEWVFIPPGSPNFGGLWEAAVKSVKSHMKKIVGKSVLTFEELVTLCCDIEAILNSRPLVPLSDDPNDLDALTPFMLLTGGQSKTMPIAEQTSLPSDDLCRANPIKRWLHVQHLTSYFWKRWSKEYLTTLQPRSKHVKEVPNLAVNDMVLLTDERLPPLSWPLGRIIEVFPGNDGHVRTVLVRTQNGIYKRPAFKARKLPGQKDQSSQ